MVTTTVAAPTDREWLAERGIVVGARVGSCVGSCVAAHHPFGTVIAVNAIYSLAVRWDDATTESVTWSAIAPLGYVVEAAPVAASASQWASASVHLELRNDPLDGWRTVRIEGVRYVRMVSGTSGKVYLVRADARGCECRWYDKTAGLC